MRRTGIYRNALEGGGRARERGQSLIVAVIVMFVLLFIGGIFVGLVARNLINAGQARDVISAQQFAEAGIRQAQNFLLYSAEGADWRPAPTPATNPQDPDKQWLDAGYSRIEYEKGRALIRVTYQPGFTADPNNPAATILDPLGKYIKIEAVGRVGFLNQSDPTTFTNLPAPRLRREYLAYMQLGLTDFLRFVTNKNKDSKVEAAIGVPPLSVPLAQQLGKLPVRTFGAGAPVLLQTGAPMRFNCGLRLLGSLTIAEDRRNSEAVMVGGPITVDDPANPPTYFDPQTNATGIIRSSDDPGFDSFAGRIRDSSGLTDIKGYARSIPTLDPPLIDLPDVATGVTRFRMSTRDSGRWLGPPNNSFNTGRIGLGAGLYISNFGNTERQSNQVAGGQSMRSLWLNKGGSQYWNSQFYIPPGAFIEFGYQVVQDRDQNGALIPGQFVPRPGFRIVRDVAGGDRPFTDPNGNVAPAEMKFTFFIYKPVGRRPVIKVENDFFRAYLINAGLAANEAAVDAFLPEFNGVIFAEGNIRTRGLLCSKQSPIKVANNALNGFEMAIRQAAGDPDNLSAAQIRDAANLPAVTLVSGANIYIEGSLVRESYTQLTGPKATLPGSMLALLAEEYVCVNPTLFVAPNKAMGFDSDFQNREAPFHYTIDTAEANQTPPFALDFVMGDDPTRYTIGHRDGDPPVNGTPPLNLLLRHGTASQQSFLNLYVNPAFTTNPGDALYLFNANLPPYDVNNPPPYVYVLAAPQAKPNNYFEQREFPLLPKQNRSQYTLFTVPGFANQIRPALDPNFTSSAGGQDYLLSRAGVAPMDVRIEAVMYAQNGSFFIVPGYPMNLDQSDTRDAALRRAAAMGMAAGTMARPEGVSPLFPFYGEPYDCRITIVGTICENRTASVSDQSAWMQLWGWMPETMGSTGRVPGQPLGTGEILVPNEHLRLADIGSPVPNVDPRTNAEKTGINIAGQTFGITRGLRTIYDPVLPVPFPNATPVGYGPDIVKTDIAGNVVWAHQTTGALRQDDFGRFLPPLPRMPVCPNFVFYGEVR